MGILDFLLNKPPIKVSDLNDAAAPSEPNKPSRKDLLKDIEITEEYVLTSAVLISPVLRDCMYSLFLPSFALTSFGILSLAYQI